jgi:tRNA modification GTPase
VVLAGAPNVGKSSLINQLAGFNRAIISPQPGTTRDVVTTTTAIAGWPVELADTAGLRQGADPLESAGVALAADVLARTELVVLVADASVDGQYADGGDVATLIGALRKPARIIEVHNKVDLLDAAQRAQLEGRAGIATSAATGEGVPDLVAAIGRALVPTAPPAGAGVPFTAEQVAGLEAARHAVAGRDATSAAAALQALLEG